MSKVKIKYISSPKEIPAGQKYVLVVYGEKYAQTRNPLGLTITVARTVGQLSFLTAVHTAKDIAKHAGISEVFVDTAMPPGPSPTPRGMFTYVPAQDELSSNVVGLDVYNEDKQNIGTIKDIALDEAGFELARLAVKAKSESARISAIRELLDRGFGKPTQFLAADSEIIPKDTTLEQLR